jgi:PRTRC genetic system protein C
MPDEKKPEIRLFVYDGREFPDPDPKMTVDEVRQHMTTYFPELSNAETKDLGPRKKAGTEETEHLWEFKKRVGSKG